MSRARTLADLLDSTGDVKLENLDNTPEYTKPSSEPITYITGLQTALDTKVDDSQVLTDVPANAVFTDTIGSDNFLIDVDGDNLSRGQLLEEISADDGQNRFVVDNIVTSNTLAAVTNGTEGMPGVADYATGVSPVATGTQYFFSFPTAQYNEGDHESPQPHAYPLYFTSTNGRTTYQAFDTNGKKWGKQEMGTGCKITWSVIPSGIEVGEWEYGEDSLYSLTSSDWTADIGFDPAADIRWCLQEWGNISGLSFYEVPWTDARRTGTNDLDFAHINFFCTNLGSSVLGHVTDFPGSVTDTNLAVSMHKRMIDSGDIAIGTAFNWYSNSHDNSYSGTVYNFRSVVLHELGHSFGMAHTNDTGTSMYPFAQSGETIKDLADGDVKGIQTIYGLPLTGTQSTVFRTTKDSVAKDTMVVEHDFVSIGTTYDDTQLLVKGKMGVNTIFPQHEVDIVGTVRATSFDGDGSSLTGVDSLPTQTSQSGKFLTTDGSAASWGEAGGGAWELLSTISASNAGTVDMETTIDSTYDEYMIVGSGIYCSSSAALRFRLKVGGTYITSGYYSGSIRQASLVQTSFDYQFMNNGSSINNTTGWDLQTSSTLPTVVRMLINKPSVSKTQSVYWDAHTMRSTTDAGRNLGGVGITSTTGVLTGVRFYSSSGNLTGNFRLYGLTNS